MSHPIWHPSPPPFDAPFVLDFSDPTRMQHLYSSAQHQPVPDQMMEYDNGPLLSHFGLPGSGQHVHPPPHPLSFDISEQPMYYPMPAQWPSRQPIPNRPGPLNRDYSASPEPEAEELNSDEEEYHPRRGAKSKPQRRRSSKPAPSKSKTTTAKGSPDPSSAFLRAINPLLPVNFILKNANYPLLAIEPQAQVDGNGLLIVHPPRLDEAAASGPPKGQYNPARGHGLWDSQFEMYTCRACCRTYDGKNARSVARRHLQDKHGFDLRWQARRTRWDGDMSRPATQVEARERNLQAKRKWASKARETARTRQISRHESFDAQSSVSSMATPNMSTASMSSLSQGRSPPLRAIEEFVAEQPDVWAYNQWLNDMQYTGITHFAPTAHLNYDYLELPESKSSQAYEHPHKQAHQSHQQYQQYQHDHAYQQVGVEVAKKVTRTQSKGKGKGKGKAGKGSLSLQTSNSTLASRFASGQAVLPSPTRFYTFGQPQSNTESPVSDLRTTQVGDSQQQQRWTGEATFVSDAALKAVLGQQEPEETDIDVEELAAECRRFANLHHEQDGDDETDADGDSPPAAGEDRTVIFQQWVATEQTPWHKLRKWNGPQDLPAEMPKEDEEDEIDHEEETLAAESLLNLGSTPIRSPEDDKTNHHPGLASPAPIRPRSDTMMLAPEVISVPKSLLAPPEITPRPHLARARSIQPYPFPRSRPDAPSRSLSFSTLEDPFLLSPAPPTTHTKRKTIPSPSPMAARKRSNTVHENGSPGAKRLPLTQLKANTRLTAGLSLSTESADKPFETPMRDGKRNVNAAPSSLGRFLMSSPYQGDMAEKLGLAPAWGMTTPGMGMGMRGMVGSETPGPGN